MSRSLSFQSSLWIPSCVLGVFVLSIECCSRQFGLRAFCPFIIDLSVLGVVVLCHCLSFGFFHRNKDLGPTPGLPPPAVHPVPFPICVLVVCSCQEDAVSKPAFLLAGRQFVHSPFEQYLADKHPPHTNNSLIPPPTMHFCPEPGTALHTTASPPRLRGSTKPCSRSHTSADHPSVLGKATSTCSCCGLCFYPAGGRVGTNQKLFFSFVPPNFYFSDYGGSLGPTVVVSGYLACPSGYYLVARSCVDVGSGW